MKQFINVYIKDVVYLNSNYVTITETLCNAIENNLPLITIRNSTSVTNITFQCKNNAYYIYIALKCLIQGFYCVYIYCVYSVFYKYLVNVVVFILLLLLLLLF